MTKDITSDAPGQAAAGSGPIVQDPELEGIPALGDIPNDNAGADAGITAEVPDDGDEDVEFKQTNWFPVYRAFRETWWWADRPWSFAHLFMDLLLSANRTPRRKKFRGRLIEIDRGCTATAIEELAKKTRWDRKRVRTFLRQMAEEGEIRVEQKGRFGIVVRLCHYEDYAFKTTQPVRSAAHSTGRKRDSRRNNTRTPGGTHFDTEIRGYDRK